MSENIIDWLLEKSNPSVRYFTLTKLLGKPTDNFEVKAEKQLIMQSSEILSILENQNQDGSWGEQERFYTDKYRGTAWRLLLLAELGASPESPKIKQACEFILKHSQEPEKSGFSVNQSSKSLTGLPSSVIPCLTGNMIYSLIKLGYSEDERVLKAIDWILKFQRTDDGTQNPPKDGFYPRFEMCWGKHSCHMGVAKALKCLVAIPEKMRTKEINDKISDLAEYFLRHHIYKKSHDLDQISKPGWLHFGFPLMYQTDVLELLVIFAELKIHDTRLQDAIEILKAKRGSDGKWLMQNSFNGKMAAKIEVKGKPSKWITLKALEVLREYEEISL